MTTLPYARAHTGCVPSSVRTCTSVRGVGVTMGAVIPSFTSMSRPPSASTVTHGYTSGVPSGVRGAGAYMSGVRAPARGTEGERVRSLTPGVASVGRTGCGAGAGTRVFTFAGAPSHVGRPVRACGAWACASPSRATASSREPSLCATRCSTKSGTTHTVSLVSVGLSGLGGHVSQVRGVS